MENKIKQKETLDKLLEKILDRQFLTNTHKGVEAVVRLCHIISSFKELEK